MSKPIEDLTGRTYGEWTVLEYYGKEKGIHYWLCKCSCGTIKKVNSQSLRNNRSVSCGHKHGELCRQKNTKNLIGKKFGKLTVIRQIENKTSRSGARYECLCECGNLHEVSSNSLIQGHVKSCGCLFANRRKKKDNMTNEEFSKERLHGIWTGIKARCYNKNRKDYKYFGAKGIILCSTWKSNFNEFYTWSLSHGYKDNLTIDRINVYGNYEPSNCRWITISEQQLNRRKST